MIYIRRFPEDFNKRDESAFALQMLAYGLRKEYDFHTLPLIARTEYGKPYFPEYPDIHFNYSHSKSVCVCGIDHETIGVDIEDIRPYRETLAKKICHPAEWEYLQEQEDKAKELIRLWTIKEAFLKYKGIGIRSDLKRIDSSNVLKNGCGCYEDAWIETKETAGSVLSVCIEKEKHIQYIAL